VDLTWNASTSSATGYNIYRGGSSGGPYSQINSTLDSAASYIDNTVVAGNTYFYVTTAVDGNGVESVNSNQVQAVIPNP
jgi:fibronectin type 3 domain-containing protein